MLGPLEMALILRYYFSIVYHIIIIMQAFYLHEIDRFG